MFAQTTEDLEGNPLTEEAFRAIREEDESSVELMYLYRDEGNEWMKKKADGDVKKQNKGFQEECDRLRFQPLRCPL